MFVWGAVYAKNWEKEYKLSKVLTSTGYDQDQNQVRLEQKTTQMKYWEICQLENLCIKCAPKTSSPLELNLITFIILQNERKTLCRLSEFDNIK